MLVTRQKLYLLGSTAGPGTVTLRLPAAPTFLSHTETQSMCKSTIGPGTPMIWGANKIVLAA